jgi:hypothetical protein
MHFLIGLIRGLGASDGKVTEKKTSHRFNGWGGGEEGERELLLFWIYVRVAPDSELIE